MFEDVLQETLLAAYKRGAKPGRAQVHYVEVANEREARVIRNGTIGLPSPPRNRGWRRASRGTAP